APASVDLKTPKPSVPAYSVLGTWGSIASDGIITFVNPALIALQLAPPFVLLKTPLSFESRTKLICPLSFVPAYTVPGVRGSIASALIMPGKLLDKPKFTWVQLAPPFVLFNTPKAIVAYNVVGTSGSIASKKTVGGPGPMLTTLQLAPLFVVLKSPLPV